MRQRVKHITYERRGRDHRDREPARARLHDDRVDRHLRRAGRPVRELADRLGALPAITYVAICAGRYDIFTEIMCTSDDELLQVLDDDVRTLPGIA